MISIVIVSHSRRLAEGIEELARQMSGDRVQIAVAAGIDDPQNPIGTDAVAILAAIESVWSADGVMVLMDMGSAILSAEMALDLLADEQKAAVHLLAAPVVEGTFSAVVSAAAGLDAKTVIAEAMSALGAKCAHLQSEVTASTDAADERSEACEMLEWQVQNPHGIHARPAARIVGLVSGFTADVAVVKGAESANARSLNGLARLAIRWGDVICFEARGEDAAAAIQALSGLAAEHFGEAESIACPADEVQPQQPVIVIDGAVAGIVVNEGVADAPARWFRTSLPAIVERPCGESEQEMGLFDDARAVVIQRLGVQSAGPEGEIFGAHQAMLEDPELRTRVCSEIAEGKQVEYAWLAVMEELAQQYRQSSSAYLREREADVHDLARQVLCELCHSDGGKFETQSPCILLADDLMPSQVASLNKEHILGICLTAGGVTSHSAIIARAMGIPAIVKAPATTAQIPEGHPVILDGFSGQLWFAPDEPTRQQLQQKGEQWRQSQQASRTQAHLPAQTRSGSRISVLANIGGPEDVDAALEQGAEGVGLFRTEFLFQNAARLPDEEQQYSAYCQVAKAFGDRPVTIRTLDIGGDKPLAALPLPAEENPFLGLRGIRLCLAKPELFLPQLRALLRASQRHPNIQIMLPMIASVNEVRETKEYLCRMATALDIPHDKLPAVGIMIEVPAAVMIAEELAREVDFFSIGTNDLTQYIMAADRGNTQVANLVDYRHPAVRRAIEQVCRAGAQEGIAVSMCGEMAGDLSQTELLLDFGLEKFSASASRIPALKSLIRQL